MRPVVVDDEMDLEVWGHRRLDVAQEPEELLVAMVGLTLGEHATGGEIQRGKQRRRPVPDVVMGDALDVAQPQGKERLGAFQGLDLALLVDAQHQRLVRRMEVEADDVPDLLGEERVGG